MKFVSNLSKETLICSELQVKDYKELLKASYGEDINKLIFVETLCEIFAKTTNKPTEYFKKLNIIDLFCLLLDVRINSQGDICKVVITRDEKKMNLELRLDLIKGDLELIFEEARRHIQYNRGTTQYRILSESVLHLQIDALLRRHQTDRNHALPRILPGHIWCP